MDGPLDLYDAKLRAGLISDDPAQRLGLQALQATYTHFGAPQRRRWWGLNRSKQPAPSVYLHGPVGRGKSLIMDLFAEAAGALGPVERVHFHAFMLNIHSRIHALQQAGQQVDPMVTIAQEIAARTPLLCFDEFVVNNIADAMILGRLFDALWAEGLTLIATSNFAPQDLYKDGLHRSRFEPFIDRLQDQMQVLEIAARTIIAYYKIRWQRFIFIP